MEDSFVQIETLVIELLLIVSLVAIVAQRVRFLPYTVSLVVAGLLVSLLRQPIESLAGPLSLELTPDLILTLLVPPLIFEAALNLDFSKLRRDLGAILLMAVPGVVVTMFIVGGIVSLVTPLSLTVALVFGALIAATDPVSVIALFKTIRVPKRLAVLVEGESLLNDGTAIVVFTVVLGVAQAGVFSLSEGIFDFAQVVVGGLAVGILLGAAVSWLIARVDNHLIETTLTTIVAFGAFLVAERLHFSGVLAVVAAGILNGNNSSEGMSASTRIILDNFWEYIAFLANSIIFLLIGWELDINELLRNWQPILGAIVAVLVARALVVYSTSFLANRFTEPRVPLAYQHVLVWGGLRGAISLALVLSLPASMGADRTLLVTMAFGVVLFSLFVQGTTIGLLMERLGIISHDEALRTYENYHAQLFAVYAAIDRLDVLRSRHLITAYTWQQLKPELESQAQALDDHISTLLRENPRLERANIEETQQDLLRTQRTALLDLRRQGIISDETFEHIAIRIDEALDSAHAPTTIFDVPVPAGPDGDPADDLADDPKTQPIM